MKASAFEFRWRSWILVGIYVLGFTAPWDYWLRLDGAGPNTHVWGRLAIELSRAGMDISVAFRLLLIAGIVLAFAGAALRTWATACPGTGEALAAEGPYRYVRNRLYVGMTLNGLALALLMPPSGAVFFLVLLIAFQVRLMLAEEAWMGERLGAVYAEYCARAPRVMPRVRTPHPSAKDAYGWGTRAVAVGGSPEEDKCGGPSTRASHSLGMTASMVGGATPIPQRGMGQPGSGVGARWGRAAPAEIFVWGTAVSYAALGWQYNAHLLMQCVVVSLGAALVAKGVAS